MLSLICGEGNGTPLQYCYLENPMDRADWWAAIYGVAQSQTRLKASWQQQLAAREAVDLLVPYRGNEW